MKYNLYDDNLISICKTASTDDLYQLSSDIREFLIDKVSKTGGHIASNLGIVELSISLMKVFDSPRDKIIYDVGHQAYVHKILTGRAKQFDTLRQYKGLSGFPKSRESIHDAYDTGHSSTSVSAAYGMAAARDLTGDDYNVVAVIGDGSMTGGIVYEALNNIGANKTNMTIILNDNGMSISHNVGAMPKYLNRLRSSDTYDQAKESVKSALHNVPVVGDAIKDTLKSSKKNLRYRLISEEGHFIEDLGIKYFGPVDGYDIDEMCQVISAAAKYDGPALVHVITKKGKGYEWAEKYPRKFHGIGPFDVETGNVLKSSNLPSFSQVFGQKIVELARMDNKICAIAAAMGTATGLGEFWQNYPERYFDVGIAEEHAVVFAAGLAKNGYTPVVAIYSSFLQRSFDFIIEDVALQNLHVVFAIDRAGLVGADGETHHGMFDLSYLGLIPEMNVLAPADGEQLEGALEYAVKTLSGPVAIRYPRGVSFGNHSVLPKFDGSNNIISEGKDVMILAVGNMLDEALLASDILDKEGIKTGVVNVCNVKPIDRTLGNLDTRLLVTLEDNVLSGGFGETVDREFSNKKFDIINIGIPDKFVNHGSVQELRKECGIDAQSIAGKVKAHLERKA